MSLLDLGPSIGHGTKTECDWMIRRHYLQKWPGVVTCILVMTTAKRLVDCYDLYQNHVGCLVFAMPPAQTAIRYGGTTWELARLWIDDALPKNSESWFIGQAVKHVRAKHKEVEYLISYADPAHGHSGIIYKASNWIADGMTDEGRKTPRVDYESGGKHYSRMGHLPKGAEYKLVYRTSKHRFLYRLCPKSKASDAGSVSRKPGVS
jgi:hypothetical protein